MFKLLKPYVACILLVLLPLQALAAANMLACNSNMQTETMVQKMPMPHCNMHMANSEHSTNIEQSTKNSTQHMPQQQDNCKAHCANLCASLCAMTALASDFNFTYLQAASKPLFNNQSQYRSITLASLQRPPNSLS